MIARCWQGATRAADADAYLEYLRRTGLAAYRRTAGNQGVLALRRIDGDRADFLLLTLWDSAAAVRRFAGDDVTRAVFYPDDARYLVARDERAGHFDVVFRADPAAPDPAAPDGPGAPRFWATLRELLREPLEPPRQAGRGA